MKILVSLGPIIGVVIIVVYTVCVQVYMMVKGTKTVGKKYKLIYKILMSMEILCVLISIFIPKITGKSYLIDGMARCAAVVNNGTTFKVSYTESKRGWINRIELSEEELSNVRVVCTADEGKVFLKIVQEDQEKTVEITNTDMKLDLSEYEEGYVSFTLSDENAKNVAFELLW